MSESEMPPLKKLRGSVEADSTEKDPEIKKDELESSESLPKETSEDSATQSSDTVSSSNQPRRFPPTPSWSTVARMCTRMDFTDPLHNMIIPNNCLDPEDPRVTSVRVINPPVFPNYISPHGGLFDRDTDSDSDEEDEEDEEEEQEQRATEPRNVVEQRAESDDEEDEEEGDADYVNEIEANKENEGDDLSLSNSPSSDAPEDEDAN